MGALAGSQIAADAHRGDIPDPDRHALAGLDHRLFDVLCAPKPRIDADEQSLPGTIDEVGTFGEVRRFQGLDQGVERQAVAGETSRIGLDEKLLLIAADRVHARHPVDGAHERSNDPVLHRAKIGCLGDFGVKAIAAFGDEAPVRLPPCSTTLGRIATSRILVFDRIHEHFAQAGRDPIGASRSFTCWRAK